MAEKVPRIRPKIEPVVEDDLILPTGGEGGSSGFADSEANGLETDDRQANEIQEIFGTTLPQYLEPVEEIVEQIFTGKGDAESVEALTSMLTSLMAAAEQMGFEEVRNLLRQLHRHILSIDPDFSKAVPDDLRQDILGDLFDLKDIAEQMGGGSGLQNAKPQVRSRTIVEALKNKDGVGKLVLKRLSAAGLVTVDQLKMARPEEIAAVSGLELKTVLALLKQLGDFGQADAPVKRRDATSPDEAAGDALEKSKIEALHEQILKRLREETELEAEVQSLKAEIRALRFHTTEDRLVLQSLETNLEDERDSKDLEAEETMDLAYLLDDLRAKRDALYHNYVSSEEALQHKEATLETLGNERRRLEEEALGLNHEVSLLVDSVGRLKRSVAKKRPI